MVTGVACGLGAAVTQSLSYIASRHYTASRSDTPNQSISLIVLMHLWLGIFSAAVLGLVFQRGLRWNLISMPLAAAAVCNVGGQIGLTVAIRLTEPSRVSPLLTMKVLFPAVLTMIVGAPVGKMAGQFLNGWQWLAIGMCVAAGVSISRGGGGIRKSALIAVLFTAMIFAGSDWCIGLIVNAIARTPSVSPLHASLLAASILYLTTALFGVFALFTPWGRPVNGRMYPWADWRDSFAYAAAWFIAMIFLFVAFAEIGVVLGTILQCTRSFITILMGTGLMMLGYAHIEPRQPRHVILKRIAAGVLMFLGISLYILRDPRALMH